MKTTRERFEALSVELEKLCDDAQKKGKTLTNADIAQLNAKTEQLHALRTQMQAAAPAESPDLSRAFLGDAGAPADDALSTVGTGAYTGSQTQTRGVQSDRPMARWAAKAADTLERTGGKLGAKALVSGSIDVPTMVGPEVYEIPRRSDRLIDLIVDHQQIESNDFEFLQQTVRTNNADTVADFGIKPTSVFTVTAVDDRLRVVAHISEPVPERLFEDHANLIRFLESEMGNGVVDAVEDQVVAGNGTGEDFTGLLTVAGTTAVPFDTDVVTTARKARTALQVLQEAPTAWVMSPADAEVFDLLRENTAGMFLSTGQGLANIFGDLPRIVSTSVPDGTAILADWRQIRLFHRSGIRLDADRSGTHFEKNEVIVRAEGRFNIGVLRPQAFALVDLVAPPV